MTPMNPCGCGGVAWLSVDEPRYHVICENCSRMESSWTARAAVTMWNLRHPPKPVKIESRCGGAWEPAGEWTITYTDRAVIFRVVTRPPDGHFLRPFNRFRMRRSRWIPGLTFIPRWSGIPCRVAP